MQRLGRALIGASLAVQSFTVLAQRDNQPSRNATVTVNITPGHPANRFIPSHALGAGVDGHAKGAAGLIGTFSKP